MVVVATALAAGIAACSSGGAEPGRGGPAATTVRPAPAARTVRIAPGRFATVAYPATGQPPYPTIVLLHGGAFTTGDRDDPHLAAVGRALRARGYATASLDYRLGTEIPAELRAYVARTGRSYACDPLRPATGREPATDLGGPGRPCLIYLRVIARAESDAVAGIATLRARAATLGLRTGSLGVYGESAGSTLALLLGIGHPARLGIRAAVGAASGIQVPPAVGATVPLLLVTYAADAVGPGSEVPGAAAVSQSAMLRRDHRELRALGVDAELLVLPGAGHLPAVGSASFDRVVDRSVARFRRAGVGSR